MIAACERFMQLDAEQRTAFHHGIIIEQKQALESHFDALSDDQHDLGRQIAKMPARTLAGMRAKARAIAAYNVEILPTAEMIAALTVSLVNDQAGEV